MDQTLEEQATGISRRGFVGGATGAALVIAFALPAADANQKRATRPFTPNAYLKLAEDGTVSVIVALVEMGQGTYTSVPMLIAEELDADFARVKVEHAPPDEARYAHPVFGVQVTGGSQSVPAAWKGLRQAGAAGRAMLLAAAAQTWGIPVHECSASQSVVTHGPSGRRLGYGQLVPAASRLPVPKDPPLKSIADFKLVGTSAPRLDTPSKVNGTARFGIDVDMPRMKVAAIANAPVIGATVDRVESAKAHAVKGVRRVLVTDTAVAVVADHYGAAKKALALLEVTWKDGTGRTFSSQVWRANLQEALKRRGMTAHTAGNFDAAAAAAPRRHEAVYEVPPLAHATMEPLNCTIHVRKGACDVWLGTQAPARAQAFVARELGIPATSVTIHNFLLGGGFGRKLDVDYVVTAARLARQVDYPLKVIFSREEDIQHDVYRPAFRDELVAALDTKGALVGFRHRIAGSSVIARYEPKWLVNGVDLDVVHTAETPYDIANKLVEFVQDEPPAGLTTGNWRGVGPTHNAFANECFVDELAHLAGTDPVKYRAAMLRTNPRLLAVLQQAAARSGWEFVLPAGTGRGVALIDAWGSYGALVTEVGVSNRGEVAVKRMVAVIDCGVAVNPSGVEAQIQGGLVFGLTAALYGAITIEAGRVVQSNFHDYRPLRMNEVPQIDVVLVKSGEAPGGVGEIGTALVAPSLLNAIFAAGGKRVRTYPVSSEQLTRSA